jgi:hypothetical protein
MERDRVESFIVQTETTSGNFSDVVSARDIEGFLRGLKDLYEDADIHGIVSINITWHV